MCWQVSFKGGLCTVCLCVHPACVFLCLYTICVSVCSLTVCLCAGKLCSSSCSPGHLLVPSLCIWRKPPQGTWLYIFHLSSNLFHSQATPPSLLPKNPIFPLQLWFSPFQLWFSESGALCLSGQLALCKFGNAWLVFFFSFFLFFCLFFFPFSPFFLIFSRFKLTACTLKVWQRSVGLFPTAIASPMIMLDVR